MEHSETLGNRGEAYDERNEWIECPQCSTVMVPLRDYELQNASEFPAIEAEWWEFVLFGWTVYLYNFLYGLITYGGRKARLAKQKSDLLPRFPYSLVCPRCIHAVKRA